MTSRSVLAGGCLALAMLTTAACVPLNEAINSRDLKCGAVPEDICVRLADDIVGHWDPEMVTREGPLALFRVRPVGCDALPRRDAAMTRCWEVLATTAVRADGSDGVGFNVIYYQNVSGGLFDEDGVVVGN